MTRILEPVGRLLSCAADDVSPATENEVESELSIVIEYTPSKPSPSCEMQPSSELDPR